MDRLLTKIFILYNFEKKSNNYCDLDKRQTLLIYQACPNFTFPTGYSFLRKITMMNSSILTLTSSATMPPRNEN